MLRQCSRRLVLQEKRRGSRDHLRRPVWGVVLLGGLLLASSGHAADPAPATLSFCRPPFVHPRLIEDLLSWESDSGDQVVAINLLDANGSNRYYGEIHTRGVSPIAPRHPLVYAQVDKSEAGVTSSEELGYEYVGLTRSGVHVLLTWSHGNHTMVPNNLLFVTIEEDRGLTNIEMPNRSPARLAIRLDRRRLLIRKLAEVALGDRWEGELRVDGNKVFVGRDRGKFSDIGPYNSTDVVLELQDSRVRPGILQPCP